MTSVTTSLSAALKPATPVEEAGVEETDWEAVEPAAVEDEEDAGLLTVDDEDCDAVEEVVLEEAWLDGVEGVAVEDDDLCTAPEDADVVQLGCEAAEAGQLACAGALLAALLTVLQGMVLDAEATPFSPNRDSTYCWTSLQVPCTLHTTVLQADSSGLQALVFVWGVAAATESGRTAVVTAMAILFFH
ncbi:MAG: hypothetical protein ABF904_08125 [Ethanoligenens sp.]